MPALKQMREASPDLMERVVLCGSVPRGEIESALASFDVAVQPAVTPYACPMKILEYMAAGRPIVAPGSANVKELLTHGETALLCSEGPEGYENPSAEDLSAAVLTLVRDPQLRTRLGEAARASLFERGYLWEDNARRVEELVAEARKERTAAAPAASREVPTC